MPASSFEVVVFREASGREPLVLPFHSSSLAAGGKIMSIGFVRGQPRPRKKPQEIIQMSFSLTADQEVVVSLVIKDQYGNDARVDGLPAWEASNVTVLAVRTAADGMSAVVTAKGPAGTSQVKVVCDADLGEGLVETTGLLDREVPGGQAPRL